MFVFDFFGLGLENQYRLVAFVVAFVVFMILQMLLPARKNVYPNQRQFSNYFLQIINVGFLLIIPLTLTEAALQALFARTGLFNSQLLAGYYLGLWTKIIVCWIVLDFVMYWWHRAMHQFQILWRVHRVHHGDPQLDLTTTFRTHPVETLLTLIVRAGVIYLLGMPLLGVILYEVIVCTMALFIHSNIRLFPFIDKLLGFLIMTPNLHSIHHSEDVSGYQTNFGLVLSIWDRLFRTLQNRESQSHFDTIGLQGLRSDNQQDLRTLLLSPLKSST